jgi:hypothetical protein
MPVAACRAAAEWAGWICKKDGRAQRVQTALISRQYAENSNWRRVQIVFQIRLELLNRLLELLNRLIVHAGRSPVRFYPFVCFPNPSLGNTPRLRLIQKTPPVAG